MSGHSKWSTIKHQKEITDQKRGQLFTKLANTITLTAREAGGNPETNFKLRVAIEKAREQNMPSFNIERAIKRGTGEIEGAKIEEATYEGYGPSGVALIINTLTDNKNRALNEIRNILARFGGKLGQPGSVSYLFKQRGVITVESSQSAVVSKQDIELAAIDAGAVDFEEENNTLLVYTNPKQLIEIKKALEEKGLKIISASLSMEPKNPVKIEEEQKASQILKLLDALDECEDVSNVYANFDVPDEIIEKIEK